ncbi:unnamed protein product [Urochloa humidicola]
MSPSDPKRCAQLQTSGGDAPPARNPPLPLDIVENEILIRLPARTLCRFRAVCRQWRSDLSDPSFIRAHASRHPTLHLVTLLDSGNLNVVDMAGTVVRRIRLITGVEAKAPRTRHGPVILVRMPQGRIRLLNLATGAACPLPGHGDNDGGYYFWSRSYSFACGEVPSTGEYKVLRIARTTTSAGNDPSSLGQTCDVLTVTRDGPGQWRRRGNPLVHVQQPSVHRAIVNGVVYFLPSLPSTPLSSSHHQKKRKRKEMTTAKPQPVRELDQLQSFDLDKEEWCATTLRVPVAADIDLSLTEMNGSLVAIHRNNRYRDRSVDLWFLRDAEKGLWVKEYSIRHNSVVSDRGAKPLMVMNDGRIIVHLFLQPAYLLIFWAYDPGTDTITCMLQLPSEEHNVLYMYPGSLLCL